MRLTTVVLVTATLGGCSRFVWNEEPFTPDPAPVSETIVSGTDTTYVLRGSSYYLLASRRSILWQREVLDAVSWRYRELFAEAPPLIAIRVDSSSRAGDTTWRGVPLTTVASHRRDSAAVIDDKRHGARDAPDSPAALLVMRSLLATAAAEAWLAARTADASRNDDGEAGDPARATAAGNRLPAWLQSGAVRILASPSAAILAAAEMRAKSNRVLPLASLFAVRWPGRPNETQAAVGPLFVPQSVSVLAFMRERDPTIVARLADELPRGRTVPDVVANSGTLPHDVARLEAEWKKWVERVAKRR
jgi:hypothetical protein